jgi:hypothetical protein
MKLPRELERRILAMPGVTVRARHGVIPDPAAPAAVALVVGMAELDRGRLRTTNPVKAVGEVNARDWKARSRRTDAAWSAVSRTLGRHLSLLAPFADAYHGDMALRILFTRLGGRRMDRSNLPTAIKATEDALAFMMGACDGDPRWRSEFAQEPGGVVGVRIELEVAKE